MEAKQDSCVGGLLECLEKRGSVVFLDTVLSVRSYKYNTILSDRVHSSFKNSSARGCQRYKSCTVFTPEGLVFILSVVFECLQVLKFKISIFWRGKHVWPAGLPACLLSLLILLDTAKARMRKL